MSNTTMKELHCKMCYEKFCGPSRLLQAVFHLKNQHRGIFQRQYKRKHSKDADDLRSPEVSSSRSSPDSSLPSTRLAEDNSQSVVKTQADNSTPPPKKTLHPVPGKMRIYFSLNESASSKPYKCNRCGRDLTNLKMCVVHLFKDHGIPLKQNHGPVSSADDVSSSGRPQHPGDKKLRQTARKSTGSFIPTTVKLEKWNKNSAGRFKTKDRRRRNKVVSGRSASGGEKVAASRKVPASRLRRKAERKRIMKIKVALMRQRRDASLPWEHDDAHTEVYSPEDCFDSSCFDSCSQDRDEDADESVVEGVTRSEQFEAVVASMDVSSSTPDNVEAMNGPEKDEDSSSVSTAQEGVEAPSTSTPQTKHPSLWNFLCWNSTQALANNRTSSNETSLRKFSAAMDSKSSQQATSGRKSPTEASAPQSSTAMLKQLRTNSSNHYRKVRKSQSLGSNPKQRSEPVSASSVAHVQPHPAPVSKKTARKTTRPIKVRSELLQNKDSTSVMSYIQSHENEQCFSKDVIDQLSFSSAGASSVSPNARTASPDVFDPRSSSNSPLNHSSLSLSTLTPPALSSSQSTLSQSSSSQSPLSRSSSLQFSLSSHSSSVEHVDRNMLSNSTPRKATGRKSFRSKS